jgi:hypothetical protein
MEPIEIFRPYAETGFYLIQKWKEIDRKTEESKDPISKKILSKQKQTIKHLIDRTLRLTGDFVPVHVSKKAEHYINQNNLGNIFEIGWGEQAKFEKQPNRKTCKLKHEHKIPVNEQIGKLMKARTIEDVLEIYLNQEIVWILKEEDKKLPKSKRPDSDKAYRDAQIEIIKNPNNPGHLFR